MSQIVCANCGIPALPGATVCHHCQRPLRAAAPGIVLQDGYVLPPPPPSTSTGLWHKGSKLVMSKGMTLPDRCVKCNVQTNRKVKRKLSWHHPALFLLIIFGAVIYIGVALALRQEAVVYLGVCDEHYSTWRRNILITCLLIVGSLASFFLALKYSEPILALLGLVLLFGGAIFGVIAAKLVTPAKIDKKLIWLKGINQDYLNSLPPWPETR